MKTYRKQLLNKIDFKQTQNASFALQELAGVEHSKYEDILPFLHY